MTRMKTYPIADRPSLAEQKALGVTLTAFLPSIGLGAKNIATVRTGEYRPPKKGEWYLSGAIPHAYKAPNDLSTPFHILNLVKTETVTITKIVKTLVVDFDGKLC